MAQSGQLRGRVSEEQLIGLLEQVRSNPAIFLSATDACYADGRGTRSGSGRREEVKYCGMDFSVNRLYRFSC